MRDVAAAALLQPRLGPRQRARSQPSAARLPAPATGVPGDLTPRHPPARAPLSLSPSATRSWANTSQPALPWEPKGGYCDHSPIGGPSEENLYCTADMGLTQADTTAIRDAWWDTIHEVEATIVAHGGFAWSSFFKIAGAPQNLTQCLSYFRHYCSSETSLPRSAMQMTVGWDRDTGELTQGSQDLASFLLTRGPYAWLGYGWIGCTNSSVPGAGGSGAYAFPPEWRADYGEPVDATRTCAESVPGASGVFTRAWTKADVSFDCNTFTGSVTPKA